MTDAVNPTLQMLCPEGTWKDSTSSPNHALMVKLYQGMHFTRLFDEKAVYLQRTGRLGTFPSSYGQEAMFVAAGMSLDAEDIYCPYYRDQGAMFQRGVTPSEILRIWGGDERGHHYVHQPKDLPICVPIATQCTIAAGLAYGMHVDDIAQAVVCTLGDGATSKGDFYEALNFASIHQLPLIFLINNNRLAISVPIEQQMGETNLTLRARGCNVASCCVDGHDAMAVHTVMKNALQHCKQGKGPYLIEAQTHRMCDHTTADDASRYVPQSYFKEGHAQDCLKRFKIWLTKHGGITDDDFETWHHENTSKLEAEIERHLNTTPAPPTSCFDHMYAHMPDGLVMQQWCMNGSTES